MTPRKRIMNKWIKRGAVVVALGAMVASLSGLVARAKAQQAATPKFKTVAIQRGAITQAILASGTLQPVNSISVGVQVSGTVAERLVDFNDHVQAGQVLLRLNPVAFQARIRESRAQLASATASLSLAQSNDERNARLLEQGFISGSARDKTTHELDVARANVEVAKAQLESAQADLDNSIVRSPIAGVVIKRTIDVGQTVAASFQTPELFRIAQDLTHMLIHANLGEADVGQIRIGQPVRFDVDAYPGREFDGRVQQFRLDATNTAGVVTYDVVIDVDNRDELLKPGMTANTRIVVATRENALRVATAALRFRPEDGDLAEAPKGAARAPTPVDAADDGVSQGRRGGAKVYRVYTVGTTQEGRNRAVQHDVTTGISNQRYTEIVAGDFKAGDQLIVRTLGSGEQGQE
jgi:HlyD family secretion protein